MAAGRLHASLPWFGPPGIGRRSVLFRVHPGNSIHRSGRGQHWGGSWWYENVQPEWVERELTAEQKEVLSPPRGTLASTVPAVPEGFRVEGGVARPVPDGPPDWKERPSDLEVIAGGAGHKQHPSYRHARGKTKEE